LIDIVSRGGNLLLNVGPSADGRIPVIMQQRLVDIGDWLKVNGEAIYGTRPWAGTAQNLGRDKSRFFTRKKNNLYVLSTTWPQAAFKIAGVKAEKGTNVSLLGYSGKIKWKPLKDGILIEPPSRKPGLIVIPSRIGVRDDGQAGNQDKGRK